MNTFDVELVTDAGMSFAKSEVMAGQAIANIATVLGQSPVYELWEAVFTVWTKAYQASAGCNDDAVKMARSRFYARLKNAYGVSKPKATTAKAVETDAKRQDAQTAAENWAAQCGQDIELMRSAAATLYASGNKAEFKIAELAIKAVEKEAKALSVDALRDLKETLRGLIKSANAAQLQAAIDAMQ
jgi:hypothetical protein